MSLRPTLLAVCSIVVAGHALCAQNAPAPAQLPPLPDSTGWGVHVLTAVRDPGGTLWVGTYGQGIYRLPAGTKGHFRSPHQRWRW